MLNFLAFITFALLLVSTVKAGLVSLSTGIGEAVWGRLTGSESPLLITGSGRLSSLPSGVSLGPPGSAERLVPGLRRRRVRLLVVHPVPSTTSLQTDGPKLAYKGPKYPAVQKAFLRNKYQSTMTLCTRVQLGGETVKSVVSGGCRGGKIRLSSGSVGRTCHV